MSAPAPAPTVRVVAWLWREVFYPERGEKWCHRRQWNPEPPRVIALLPSLPSPDPQS